MITADLSGKRALVTGGASGIGLATARLLARCGARVAINHLAEDERGPEAVAALRKDGLDALAVAGNVTDADDAARMVGEAVGALGGLDILINNAGIEQVSPSLEVDEALWDRIVDTNLKGAFFCAQAAARRMAPNRAKGGAIVNLCSLTSGVGVPTAAPYGSSKSGLLGMTRALAAEWAPDIRVNAIGPGYFRTELTEVFYQDPTWCAKMLEKIPAGRFGALDDLVGATVFLCSDAARYVTGQLLYIDGGYMASI